MKTLSALSNAELLHTTHAQLQRSHELDVEILLLLAEIEARKLYAERAHSSMFKFCMVELGFSEDVTCNRLEVMRLARRFPRVLDFVREGRIHLTGLRLLSEVLTEENLEPVLAETSGKSKREIVEIVARLAPRPSVPPSIRKLPTPAAAVVEEMPSLPLAVEEARAQEPAIVPVPLPVERRPVVEPLSGEAFLVKFTADRALNAKLERAQELMGRRGGRGNLVAVIDRALDLLIEEIMKERFAVGRKARTTAANAEQREVDTRHIPDAIKREVYVRDGGQCTFVSADGRRCEERGDLEYEHVEGFARTGRHMVDGITLHCRTPEVSPRSWRNPAAILIA